LLTAASNWLTWRTRLHVHRSILEAAVGRLHTLPISYHREHGTGSLMTRLDRGIQGFLSGLSEIAFNVLPAVVYLAIAAGVLIELDVRLAALAFAFAPIPAVLAVRAAPEQTKNERQLLDRWAKIYGRFNEVLTGIVTVRSFAMEEREKQRFLSDVRD